MAANKGAQWTDADDKIIGELKADKRTNKYIARRLGRTEASVGNRWHNLRKKEAFTIPAPTTVPKDVQSYSGPPLTLVRANLDPAFLRISLDVGQVDLGLNGYAQRETMNITDTNGNLVLEPDYKQVTIMVIALDRALAEVLRMKTAIMEKMPKAGEGTGDEAVQ